MARRDSVFMVIGRHAGDHPVLVVAGDSLCAGVLGFGIGRFAAGTGTDKVGIVLGAIAAFLGALAGLASVSQARRERKVTAPSSGGPSERPPVGAHASRGARRVWIAVFGTSKAARLVAGAVFALAAAAAYALGLHSLCGVLLTVGIALILTAQFNWSV
jgi:hypothetical protein